MKAPADTRTPDTRPPVERQDVEAPRRELRSEDLFAGAHVVFIRHADAVYTLRRTSNGKLILTK